MTKKPRVKPLYYPLETPNIYNTIQQIPKEEYKMLATATYLFGTRITETLHIQPQDLKLHKIGNKHILKAEVLTLKNKKTPTRTPYALEIETEGKMLTQLWNYTQNFKKNQYIWNMSRQQATYHFGKAQITTTAINLKTKQKYTITRKLFPHYLRHCRASNLVNTHQMEGLDLTNYMGWSDPKLAMVYVKTNWRKMALKTLQKWREYT